MKMEQYEHFQAALKNIGDYLGQRCRAREPEAFDSVSIDEAKVRAAAVTMSVLVHLREMSHTKNLGPNDVQLVIDGFYDAAEIEETRTAMGAIVYQRKQKEVV